MAGLALGMGVRYFLVFESATWNDPKQSKLWPSLKPFVEANAALLVPWATNACGGPHVKIEAGQRGGIGLTDFGGPSTPPRTVVFYIGPLRLWR